MTTHTEEEAKTKWCPARQLQEAVDVLGGNCVGSGCTVWQWDEQELWRDPEGNLFSKKIEPNYEKQPDRGYCGLTRGSSHE